jgi:hypothetical protein
MPRILSQVIQLNNTSAAPNGKNLLIGSHGSAHRVTSVQPSLHSDAAGLLQPLLTDRTERDLTVRVQSN